MQNNPKHCQIMWFAPAVICLLATLSQNPASANGDSGIRKAKKKSKSAKSGKTWKHSNGKSKKKSGKGKSKPGKSGKGCQNGGPRNILLTNDDGFDTPNIQTLFTDLTEAGHNVVMSAPFGAQSGISASIEKRFLPFTAIPGIPDEAQVGETTENSTCATLYAGSPPLGETTIQDKQYYLDGPPVLAVLHGIDVLSPKYFDGKKPDLVISGPNAGVNMGLTTPHSGTVGAAVSAINRGIPTVAISVDNNLVTDNCNPSERSSPQVISALTSKVVEAINCDNGISLPPSVGLNVNIPSTAGATLDDVDDYVFKSTRIGLAAPFGNKFYEDLKECESWVAGLSDEQKYLAFVLLADVPLPGLCVDSPYTDAGYPKDNDKKSEFFAVYSEPPRPFKTVSVSVIEGTYQAPKNIDRVVKKSLEELFVK